MAKTSFNDPYRPRKIYDCTSPLKRAVDDVVESLDDDHLKTLLAKVGNKKDFEKIVFDLTTVFRKHAELHEYTDALGVSRQD